MALREITSVKLPELFKLCVKKEQAQIHLRGVLKKMADVNL